MYYVVKIGRQPGIYESWTEAEKHVSGYSGAKYKSFKTLAEAEAWLSDAKKYCSETITDKLNPNATGVTPSQNKYEHLPLDKDAVLKYDCRKLNIHNIIYAITENTTKILPATWTEYDGCLYIFTDGSYKKSSNKAGTGIFFGETGVSLKLPDGFTNNQAELIGILYALQQIKLNAEQLSTCDKHVIVISDSMYCINTVTKWMKAWEKNNWKKGNGESILNPELIQTINTLWSEINKKKSGSNLCGKVKFEHQNSHTTAPVAKQSREYMLWHGNHMADMLATN
jgi:ribonuclease HI